MGKVMSTIFILVLFLLFLAPEALSEETFQEARLRMVQEQIEQRGITDPLVLSALRSVPRHEFVPENMKPFAYEDTPLPIGYGQTISQPYIVALMTEKAGVKPGSRVLEVGTGSGYQAAILCAMGCEVYSVEIIKALAERARETLERLGYSAKVFWGDGYFGLKEFAPFDAIIVTCSIDHIPPPLIEQLKEGGKMVIPVGPPWSIQSLLLVEKTPDGIRTQDLGAVRFVPLTRTLREK